jgi:hypothetical protein
MIAERRSTILVSYICWLIVMALSFLALVSARELGLALLAIYEVDIKIVGLIDKIGFFGFGVVGLAVIVLSEGYLRNGARTGRLAERCGLLFGILLLCLFVTDGVRYLLPGLVDAARPNGIQVCVDLILGGLCIGLFRRLRR